MKARDEVAQRGQVITDLLSIAQVTSRTNSNTSFYSDVIGLDKKNPLIQSNYITG